MFPSLYDDLCIEPEDGPHSGESVRRHVNSMTASAKKDAPRSFILCNPHRNLLGNIDVVIRGIKPMSADVFHNPAGPNQNILQLFFELESAVIGAKINLHKMKQQYASQQGEAISENCDDAMEKNRNKKNIPPNAMLVIKSSVPRTSHHRFDKTVPDKTTTGKKDESQSDKIGNSEGKSELGAQERIDHNKLSLKNVGAQIKPTLFLSSGLIKSPLEIFAVCSPDDNPEDDPQEKMDDKIHG